MLVLVESEFVAFGNYVWNRYVTSWALVPQAIILSQRWNANSEIVLKKYLAIT